MLYCDRIDVSEGIDVKKTSESNDCDICHYWYFLNKMFTFQPNVCNGSHNLLMTSMNLSNIAIINIKCVDYFQNWQKGGHKLSAKYQFDQKNKNIFKHKIYYHIYKNG